MFDLFFFYPPAFRIRVSRSWTVIFSYAMEERLSPAVPLMKWNDAWAVRSLQSPMHHDLVLLKYRTVHHVRMHLYHVHPTGLIQIQKYGKEFNPPISPWKRTIFDVMTLLAMKWSLILHQILNLSLAF